jgi:hypothetical protein
MEAKHVWLLGYERKVFVELSIYSNQRLGMDCVEVT